MSTSKDYAEYILETFGNGFTAKPMFGEYGLYYNQKIAAFICDNRLLIKQIPQSEELKTICEMDYPYPGAKLHYHINDDQLSEPQKFIEILKAVAATAPEKKKRPKPL